MTTSTTANIEQAEAIAHTAVGVVANLFSASAEDDAMDRATSASVDTVVELHADGHYADDYTAAINLLGIAANWLGAASKVVVPHSSSDNSEADGRPGQFL